MKNIIKFEQDENHTILLFDWEKGFLKAKIEGGKQKVSKKDCINIKMI